MLGTYGTAENDSVLALLTVERQHIKSDTLPAIISGLDKATSLLINDIYHLYLGWSGSGPDVPAGEPKFPTSALANASTDLKITLVQPATELVSIS